MVRQAFDPVRIFSVLGICGVNFVAIGGWAAGAHDVGWPTFDLDILVQDDASNLDKLATALEALEAEYDTFHSPRSNRMLNESVVPEDLSYFVQGMGGWTS